MCDHCSDLRYIEPAHSISLRDEYGNLDSWIQDARDNKKFLTSIYNDGKLIGFMVIEKCPVCGYVFTDDDYNRSKLV